MKNKFLLCLSFVLLVAFSQQVLGEKHVIGVWPRGGMGVSITSVLNSLIWCEWHNKAPVVYWPKMYSLYYSASGFNGKGRDNTWEYYFEPVSSLKYRKGDKIYRYCPQGLTPFSYNKVNPKNRKLANEIIKKYIKFNKVVQKKIDQFYAINIAGKKTIGIHLRGTDKEKEQPLIPPEIMVKEALKYADSDTQFFIATDEQRLFDKMKCLLEEAGHKVVYYDCYRSQNGQPLHVKKPSKAQLGEDVIVEMALLAKCDFLVHTLSNVSLFPLYLNHLMGRKVLTGDDIANT